MRVATLNDCITINSAYIKAVALQKEIYKLKLELLNIENNTEIIDLSEIYKLDPALATDTIEKIKFLKDCTLLY